MSESTETSLARAPSSSSGVSGSAGIAASSFPCLERKDLDSLTATCLIQAMALSGSLTEPMWR